MSIMPTIEKQFEVACHLFDFQLPHTPALLNRIRCCIKKDGLPVLIIGESGTGKELLANLIHVLSNRRDQPFKAINCNAIPNTLFESELFGHAKNTFTGANKAKDGLLKSAASVTVFIDEIGDLEVWAQVKLL